MEYTGKWNQIIRSSICQSGLQYGIPEDADIENRVYYAYKLSLNLKGHYHHKINILPTEIRCRINIAPSSSCAVNSILYCITHPQRNSYVSRLLQVFCGTAYIVLTKMYPCTEYKKLLECREQSYSLFFYLYHYLYFFQE